MASAGRITPETAETHKDWMVLARRAQRRGLFAIEYNKVDLAESCMEAATKYRARARAAKRDLP